MTARPVIAFDVTRARGAGPLLGEPAFPAQRLRDDAADFRVDEVALFAPEGEGEHLFLHVEKRGASTQALVAAIARAYGISPRDIGFAGRKDARGVTSQWVSAPRRKIDDDGARLAGEGPFVVDDARPHRKKLHLGSLRGNRFTIVVRPVDAPAPLDVVVDRARALARAFPNRFGHQRFGREHASLDAASRFIARGRPARSRTERFLVSVAQSAWFNGWLKERQEDGLLFTAVDGEVLGLAGRGSTFLCEDAAQETPRIARGEVDPRGPLFGAAMRPAVREGLTRESRSLTADGIDPALFHDHPAFSVGERRPAIARVEDLDVADHEGARALSFTLPKGSYATVFLEEIFGASLADAALDMGDD